MTAEPYATILGPIVVDEALDVGCGSGSFTRTLAQALGGFRTIIGIDPDKDSVDEARRLSDDDGARPRVRYRVMSAFDMPFADGRFDLVSISNTLHHLQDPSAVLRRIARAIRPGGALVIQELVSDGLSPREANERDVHHLKAGIDELHGRVHRPTFTRAEIRSLIASLGGDARLEASAEVTDSGPGPAGSERAQEVLGFLGEYLEFVRGEPAYPEFQADASRIGGNILEHGIATPPRLLLLIRLGEPR